MTFIALPLLTYYNLQVNDKTTKAPTVQNEKINIKGNQNNKPAVVKNRPIPNGTKEKTQNTHNKNEQKSKDFKK